MKHVVYKYVWGVSIIADPINRIKEIFFSKWPKTCCSFLAADGPGTLHSVSGHPVCIQGAWLLSWLAGDIGAHSQCLGEEKCRHYSIKQCNIRLVYWNDLFLFYIFQKKCNNACIFFLSSYLWGKPELSFHDSNSLLALITQSRSEGRAKLFYK